MPITREKKETIITDLKKLIEKASILVFVNFHGLSVAKERKLRGQLRGADIKYKVAKKTLLKKVLESAGFMDAPKLEGEIGVVAGYSEVTKPPALLVKFIKGEKEGLKIIGGIYESKYVGADIIKQLGAIPSREVLLTQIAFILSQPVASLARALSEVSKKGQN
ncbi:50S ribosomal protein L10 [Candidatus Giovannonibacteria bacterium RIFCSPHIGHO2_02_FULL_43_32]|nr:MAG: 50S ribosomal protein L10 [Candidatus Giovannonibacteria bacterium RIFCSPHIGHO2_02_FULL_43_32]